MKHILVTGGNGFIGKNLMHCLIRTDHKVVFLEKPDYARDSRKKRDHKIIKKDLVTYNPKEGLSKGFDIIIHLAGNLITDKFINEPEPPFFQNIYSTLNILEDIRQNNKDCLLIFTSTEKVYGNVDSNAAKKAVDEEAPCTPIDAYGTSKLICELLIKEYHLKFGINYIIFRPANVFGQHQKHGLFIPSILTKVSKGDKEIIVGNLGKYRNFVYVTDLIDAIINSIDNSNAQNNIFNIGSYNLKIEDVLKTILEISKEFIKSDVKIVQDAKLFRPLRYETERFILDCEKASKILRWKPRYKFEEAIRKTTSYYLNHLGKKRG